MLVIVFNYRMLVSQLVRSHLERSKLNKNKSFHGGVTYSLLDIGVTVAYLHAAAATTDCQEYATSDFSNVSNLVSLLRTETNHFKKHMFLLLIFNLSTYAFHVTRMQPTSDTNTVDSLGVSNQNLWQCRATLQAILPNFCQSCKAIAGFLHAEIVAPKCMSCKKKRPCTQV